MKVSVIIPVYNVGAYLGECLDSVVSQTLEDIEIICVDDGSTDDSPSILQNYAARDGRIRILSQVNKGPAAARNNALLVAAGEYVAFMDPDDRYSSPDVLLDLVGLAESLGCEVAGGYIRIFGGKEDFLNDNWMKKNKFPHLGIINFGEYQSPFGYQRYIFSREMLSRNNIVFPDLRRFQDPPFCAFALHAAGNLAVIDKVVYDYRKQHSVVNWLADDGIRAKHWIKGMHMLLDFAIEHGYSQMLERISTDFRTVLPRVVVSIPEIGREFRRLAIAVNSRCPRISKLLFVCDDEKMKDTANPFVQTIAEELERRGVSVAYGRQKFFDRCEGYQVIHFQWPEAAFGWRKKDITHADVLAFRDQIRYARSLGIRVCYTRHNIRAHYADLPNVDDLYSTIESECDTVIHMGEFSRNEYLRRYDFPLVNHRVIPHHLYEHIDRSIPKHEARRLLGIDENEKVLLAFGGFRHEEECNIAVGGFQDAKSAIPRLRLLAPRLPEKYGFGNGKPVEAKLLPLYFAASDVVLIARKKILNSGNLPLGYYFGKPVVGPDVGDVGEILRETGNPVFDVCEPSSVGRAIVAAFAAIEDGLGAHNREYAERNWNISRVVDLLYDAYQAPMSEAQMVDERRIILRDNGVPPAAWALDAMFEAIWEKVMARPCQDCTPDPRKMKGNGIYKEQYSALPVILSSIRLSDSVDEPPNGLQYAFLWGNGHYPANACVLGAALKYGATMVICEDGWLRSADTWANMKAAPRYRHGCSLILESRGCYYDATRVSTIEMMLNDRNLVLSMADLNNARRLIRRIVDNKLSKYNHQPIFTPNVGRPGKRKVLVVDQSYGDFAIRKGWADDSTFERMLQAAIDENPDADILVKTHPDAMTGTRKGYYDGLREHGNIFRVTMPINPYSLMEVVDKVYVCSTQLGFEALMAGKEVHVFGMPFYAGWGLTIDAQKNPRRTNTRSLEEIFYIFYLRYTHWMNPETERPCSIDESIDYLLKLREEYREIMTQSQASANTAPKPNVVHGCGAGGDAMKRKLQSLQKSLEEVKAARDAKSRQVKELRASLEKTRADRDAKSARLQEFRESLAKTRADRDEKSRQLQEFRAACKLAKETVIQVRSQRDELAAKLKEITKVVA